MKQRIAAALIGLTLGTAAFAAADYGVAKDAEVMVQKAVKHFAAVGKDKAFADFGTPAWVDRDLYIVVLDFAGHVVAHGTNPKLVGKDLSGLKDPDGKLFIQMISEVAKTKGKGWTDTYKFRNPTTDKIAEKLIYVERVNDTWIGVGVYK